MLVLPGGGYSMLAAHEGEGYARWLASRGVAAFVLNYRLGSSGYRHPAMLQDADRALRMIRMLAPRAGLAPSKVGVMGSSAGGHLAATLLTQWNAGEAGAGNPIDRVSSRPDLGVLCYPVITFMEYGHLGSCGNLLGENATAAQRRQLSAHLNVRKDTPPCFLWHTVADAAVPVENSLLFAQALRANEVPFDLHCYAEGRHGLGLCQREGDPRIPWAIDLEYWLGTRGFLKGPS